MVYFLVFISALAAATILPFSSEVSVIAAIHNNNIPWIVWLAASLGNTLGAVINWCLGRYIERFKHHAWFPFNPQQVSRAQVFFNRYGLWSLLLSWLPVIGDALTLIAGTLKVRFWLFLVLVTIGKSLRYAVLILTLLNLF